jgi:arsenate reductase
MKKRVLFICVHNSARSQMAEALLNQTCDEQFKATSAGLEPGTLNPLAVEVLQEIGIDITGKETQTVSDVIERAERFDYVITVCDDSSAEGCPFFPGEAIRLHWSFPDPSKFRGSWANRLEQTRSVRDSIQCKIEEFCGSNCRAVA